MFTQAKILEDAIIDSGWQMAQKLEMPEWWADEIWHLESVWSPVGISAWITFLVDPQLEHPARRKGQHVWSVAVSAEEPSDRVHLDFIHESSLKSGWEENLNGFIDKLNTIRKVV
jgi:hypothetical protein